MGVDRVALGDFSPRSPTDPSVRHSRTRLLKILIRYVTIALSLSLENAVDNLRERQRTTFEKNLKPLPEKTSLTAPAT